MSVKIRLSRMGKKDLPFYRIVAIDSRQKRDGEFLENLGTYDAVKGAIVALHVDRYDAWVAQGAQPSDTAKRIYKLHKRAVSGSAVTEVAPKAPRKAKKAASKETAE